jgi:hypothetical protein
MHSLNLISTLRSKELLNLNLKNNSILKESKFVNPSKSMLWFAQGHKVDLRISTANAPMAHPTNQTILTDSVSQVRVNKASVISGFASAKCSVKFKKDQWLTPSSKSHEPTKRLLTPEL